MKPSTLAQRNTSEKGRRAAQATKTAMAERKAAEERKQMAIKSGRRRNALPSDVPPFCYLAGGQSPEDAVIEVIKHFSVTPIEALALVWKLRDVQQAENISAENQAQNSSTRPAHGECLVSSHNTTHKRRAKLRRQQDERAVITPGHRGQTEPAREEKGKGHLGLISQTVAVSGQLNQLSKGQKA
jgi:hypothetical protein